MQLITSQRCTGVVAVLVLFLSVCSVARATVDVHVDKLATPRLKLANVDLTLAPTEKQKLRLVLDAEQVTMPAVGWHNVSLSLDGKLSRGGKGRWMFAGALALTGAPGHLLNDSKLRMAANVQANNLDVRVTQGGTRVKAALPLDQPSHARLHLQHLPMRWLRGLLAKAWSGHIDSGHVDGELAVDVGNDGIRSSGQLAVTAAGFDTASGKFAGNNVDGKGHMTLDTGDGHLALDLDLQGGELLMGTVYANLPDHDVHVSGTVQTRAHGVSIRQLHVNDPAALNLSAALVIGDGGSVRNLAIHRLHANLPSAYQRYGKTLLSSWGFSAINPTGHLNGQLRLDSHGLRSFRFRADDLSTQHAAALSVEGLNGSLDWQRGGNRPATALSWDKLGLYGIKLGGADSQWQTRDGVLTLTAPVDVPVLGGQLHMHDLTWQPDARKGQGLQTALSVTGVDVAQLSAALGWPQFSGTLAGAIPKLRYRDDRVELDGGMTMNVFDGFVDVTQLSLKHPFGDKPAMTANVSMRHLDLEALTNVFDFGRITGHLDGDIEGLHLVDWKPVAFDASVHTDDTGRISQKAVQNLDSLGGGGVTGGIQGAFLNMFDTFRYKHIGLSCRLHGDVCDMRGLKPKDDGYLIVQGRGLPHLSVVGHQHRVSWSTLVKRLETAISGQGPVVE